MTNINRRQFIGTALVAAGGLALSGALSAKAASGGIEILVNEPIGRIAPEIYGHFVEHLGAVVYDGIWVGEGSKIPNIGGIRKSVVDAMKRIKAPVIRYPGGCFADSYDWRDGVGLRLKRPRKTNFWYGAANKGVAENWSASYESNHFGTNEFNAFCRLIGAKPYLGANLRGMTAHELNNWLEYCNSPAGSTTLAIQRATGAAGSKEPYKVEYWGVGNESWGCGGEILPDEYAQEFRKFTAVYNGYGVPIKFIGAGAASDDLNWTRGFFAKMREKGEHSFRRVFAWGVHHYAWNTSGGRTNDWNAGKGDAFNFNNLQYYELLREGDKLDSYLQQHWAIMGEYDKAHRAKIAVDEWDCGISPAAKSNRTIRWVSRTQCAMHCSQALPSTSLTATPKR